MEEMSSEKNNTVEPHHKAEKNDNSKSVGAAETRVLEPDASADADTSVQGTIADKSVKERGIPLQEPLQEAGPGQDEDEPGPPRGPASEQLGPLCEDMFKKTADYLQGELSTVAEDYAVLEKMNLATATKYSDMKQIANSVGGALGVLSDKFTALAPALAQIDLVEENVGQLEQAAYRLDAYSRQLEARFKQLEKRNP